MGKRRRLNRFISKWIKSDLPEERSTVLLLNVTRIPTSPAASRRREYETVSPRNGGVIVRRNSSRKLQRFQVASEQPVTTKCPSPHIKIGESTVEMESSVDSIGACSLDVEASAAHLPEPHAEKSTDTLRSITPTPSYNHHHLPSYLSLACTVNGYSTITNYDPVRLAKSRDASPHRVDPDSHSKPCYVVQNNLLSPPNLVPLPKMETHTRFSQIIRKETVDGCIENGHIHTKCMSFESNTTTASFKYNSEITETKSFIQQRVERLYGPGALAQGFFSSRLRKSRISESDTNQKLNIQENDKHSKSMTDTLFEAEPVAMKQSASSPTLPVLRHLRPEFRAQLPILSPKRGPSESSIQKSVTIPKLKVEEAVNGHLEKKINGHYNGELKAADDVSNKIEVKDGHYFLKILEEQTKMLLKLADQVEEEILIPGLSEEVVGKLRSASGKARLLVTQKMQQFRGLCTNNINRSVGEAFPTTNEDLQGFWDMVMLQVDQVNAIFDDIDQLRRNNWQELKKDINGTSSSPPKANGTNSKPKKQNRPGKPESASSIEARKLREMERKKMIEERRKAMKMQREKKDNDNKEGIEIFVAETS